MEQRSTSLRPSSAYSGGKSGKALVRDLTESLGKLPPQALDLEEAVLGALMLEKNALPAVTEFLRPEHFIPTLTIRFIQLSSICSKLQILWI